jgi:hypothetical protein
LAGFVDTTVKEIDERLRELKEEVGRLEAARTALTSERSQTPRASRVTRRAAGGAAVPRRGRPGRPRGRRGGSTRASQALELVRAQPGITIPQLASAMKIQPNYLYRVMPALEKDGSIKREGQGWLPA